MYLDLLVFLHFILRGNIANRTSDRVGAFLRRRSSNFRSSLERRERDRNSSTASDRERGERGERRERERERDRKDPRHCTSVVSQVTIVDLCSIFEEMEFHGGEWTFIVCCTRRLLRKYFVECSKAEGDRL